MKFRLNFVNNNSIIVCLNLRVWLEIQRCAPMEMIHVLIMSKLPLIDKTTVSYDDITPDTFYQKGPPSKAILNRWKLILDLYVEHGFI